MLGFFLQQQSMATLVTQSYFSLNSQALYAAVPAMPYAHLQAPKGGVLAVAADGSFDNLNSMNGKGNAALGIHYVFDSLLSKSLDEAGVYYPLLAQKIRFDPKQTSTVIFDLNPKARFNDGSALTAEDVKFSFDLYQTQANLGLQMYLSGLKKTVVLSKHQVQMQFQHSHQPEMIPILAQMPIYAKKQWQQRDFKKISLTPILGSGPYRIQTIHAGQSIVYQHNPNYWGKDLPVNRGRYNFNQIIYRYYRSPEVQFEAFKAGKISFFEEKQIQRWMRAYHFLAQKNGFIQQLAFKHQNPIATESLVLNTRRAPLSDIRFRQALTYAYDFEWLNKAYFFGQYQRLNSFFSNSELASKGKPTPAEYQMLSPWLAKLHPIQRDLVLKDWRYPISDATGYHRQHLLVARSLLLKAGFHYVNGQLQDAKGQPVQLEFLLHQVDQQRLILPYIRNLKRLGIDAKIRMLDAAQYDERKRQYQYDIILDNMPQSLQPGQEQAQFWGSQAAQEVGNYNYAGVSNPAIDAVITHLNQTTDRVEMITTVHVLDRLLRAGYYHIPTYGTGQIWYAHWSMLQHPQRLPKLNIGLDYWWSDAQQQQAVANYLKQQHAVVAQSNR